MTHLVIGAGEIGQGLQKVLSRAHEVDIRDIDCTDALKAAYDFLHICIPYSDNFKTIVEDYKTQYDATYVVIHGTVPVGTNRQLGSDYVSSPVRGKHPDLSKGIEIFVKFLGGVNKETVEVVSEEFKKAGIKTFILSSPEAAEMGKILETTQYGWFIILCKKIKELCDEHDLNFDEVYTLHNMTYNDGYRKTAQEHYCRPVLSPIPGAIGGHCVVQNTDLLDCFVTNFVKQVAKEM